MKGLELTKIKESNYDNEDKFFFRFICSSEIILLLLILWFGFYLLRTESYIQFLKWYGTLLLITIGALPLTYKLFAKFSDDGYIFAKPIGIAISGFLMWLFASVKILKFNPVNSYICLALMIIISFLISLKEIKKLKEIRKSEYKNNKLKKKVIKYIAIEICFLSVFLLAAYVKGFNPDATCGQEKYMDFGFMKIMDKSDYMPPEDMWMSGKSINYYYFGQYIATYITKISGVGVEYGYNFGLITVFTITFFASFSIVFNLIKSLLREKKFNEESKKIIPIIGGTIAALSNTVAGNMHYVLYGLLRILPSQFDDVAVKYGYRYSNSTRYIGYNPDVADKTITEFPSYSFVVSDLHAHVVNIIFVLTVIALLLAYVFSKRKIIQNIRNGKNAYLEYGFKETLKKELLNPYILFIGFFIGLFKMTNFWDFPIYLVVSFGILLFINYIIYKNKKQGILVTILQMIEILIISTLVSLPFSLNFTKMASEIKLTTKHSMLYQLLILWGLPSILIIHFILDFLIKGLKKNKEKLNLDKLLISDNISDLFVIIIGICAIGLVIVPEFIYVKDIYGDVYQRTNTMFKMTYQAYIMFSLCLGYVLTKFNFCYKGKNILKGFVGVICLTLFVMTLGYGVEGIKSYFGNVFEVANYRGLNASLHLGTRDSTTFDDKAMIDWLNENASKNENIIEAACFSYSYGNTISVFTGLATPIGWHTHEWLWRSVDSSTNCPRIVTERTYEVKDFYETNDINNAKSIIQKYDIDYIIIGKTEREKYKVNEENIKQLGKIVFESNKSNSELPSYIIRCEK